MRALLVILLSLVGAISQGQHLDTIQVSVSGTTYLIFDDPITLFNIGTKNYTGKIEHERMIFLKANTLNCEPTTLLVQAGSLLLTAYIRFYRKPVKSFYDYRAGAMANAPQSATSPKQGFPPRLPSGKLPRMAKEKDNAHIRKKKDGIEVGCNQLFNDSQYTYVKLTIANKTTLPFIVDLISFTYKEKLPHRMRNKVAPQFEERQPDEKVEPGRVEAGRTENYYYSLPVYSTTQKGFLEIIVREQTGARVLVLTVPSAKIQKAPLL